MIHKINKVANERTNNEGAKLIIYPYYLLLIRNSKVPKCILSEFDQQVGHFITNALSTRPDLVKLPEMGIERKFQPKPYLLLLCKC